jgi:hypothetical protein
VVAVAEAGEMLAQVVAVLLFFAIRQTLQLLSVQV